MKKLLFVFLLVPATAMLLAFTPGEAPTKCHSEIYTKAKQQLRAIVLNSAQKRAIYTYEMRFQRQWSKTHRSKGCSHHEAHAHQFVAAAAGVLSDNQFKKFKGRTRNRFETVGHTLWNTERYLKNLVKIAESL